MKIAILSNIIKSNPTEAIVEFMSVLDENCTVLVAKELKGFVPSHKYYEDDELFALADVAVVFGGDGTTLTAARRAAPYKVPILSINTGHLGFLATVGAHNAKKAAIALMKDELIHSQRTMLSIRVLREEESVCHLTALNDCIIRRNGGKLVDLHIKCNKTDAFDYRADGVIVATPTGSTAYSLSCGGPLILPVVEVFEVTPICPHLLGHRPMILPSECEIEISLSGAGNGATLSADGQEDFELLPTDKVIIEKSPHKASFLTMKDYNFFNLVKEKLTSNG